MGFLTVSFVKCTHCGHVREDGQVGMPCPHILDHGCQGKMLKAFAGLKWPQNWWTAWAEQAAHGTCVCTHPTATLKVSAMSGDVMEIGVEPGWRVLEAKQKLANKTDIAVREQCWAVGQEILLDTDFMSDIQTIGTYIEVSMVRRDPEVAVWLERIEEDWTWVKSCGIQAIPAKVWKSSDSADLINGVFRMCIFL